VYVLASDGKRHAFNLISGEDLMPATKSLPGVRRDAVLLQSGLAATVTEMGHSLPLA